MEQLSWYRKFSWQTILLAGFWLAAFVATHLPKLPQAVGHVSDKTWHFATYGVLAYLLAWVLSPRFPGIIKLSLIVLLILAGYAALDEILQIPVGRQCDLEDWIADMIGTICGCTAFHLGQWAWNWCVKFWRPKG